MFKFDFGSETSQTTFDSTNKEEKCAESKVIEINANHIQALKDTVCSTLNVGSLVIKTVSAVNAVTEAVLSGSEIISTAEDSHSDLIPGEYEGGFKIWECTRDLAELMVTWDLPWENVRALDLGCGAGVLGCIALSKGSHVVFQDYNIEVLELLTRQNVLLNTGEKSNKAQLFSGDWSSFLKLYTKLNPDTKFDLIVSSETIYNVNNYNKLHDVINTLLSPDGVCYMAGKCIYFGVGGSMRAFQDFVVKQGLLDVETCWSQTEGVAREIFKIKHKKEWRQLA